MTPTPTREQIARAIYDVANRWIAPNFPKGHKLRTFDEIDGQDLALHMDYADAVLALIPVDAQPTLDIDGIAEFIGTQIGWGNGAAFDAENRCECADCDKERDDVRNVLRAALAAQPPAAPVETRKELRFSEQSWSHEEREARAPAAPVETFKKPGWCPACSCKAECALDHSSAATGGVPTEPDYEILKAGDDAYRACAGGAHYAGMDGMTCAYRAMAKVLLTREPQPATPSSDIPERFKHDIAAIAKELGMDYGDLTTGGKIVDFARALRQERDALKHDIERHVEIASDLVDEPQSLPVRPHSIYSKYHLDNWLDSDFASHPAATRKTLAYLVELEAALALSRPKL